ncbi:glucan-binding protein [Clostridium sp. AM29-11AC]|uniref:glucan-binding protein n=1 Tax=Clostridium sp. AM29-11AC TaxID=2293028 RepID=UPI000E48BF03|nr:glucan-binding protein [Clostridium sp. AM29-11AC]RHT56549.1 glucan-binding protein [Clostridium sp. AM29-11AC]
MRKQTKLVAVLSAAALLAVGASMTSFAGWEKDEDGIWHYYDSDDEMVEDEWRKDGSKWFYLDEDGNMLTDSWVDDEYYVGSDGAMLKNAWIKTTPDEDISDPDEDGDHWYYFDSKGKKVTDDSKKINGKTYYFDEDGQMLDGWHEDKGDVYYLGGEDEGWRAENQWLWLEKPGDADEDNDDEQILTCADEDDCDDEGWYWFGSNGKMYKDTGKKKVNGRYYMFNEHGQMLYEWINNTPTKVSGTPSNAVLDGSATPGTASISDMYYYNIVEEGWRGDGWYEIDGSEDVGTDSDTDWYYFDKGEAKHADAAKKDLATYDGDGEPVYVAKIKVDSSKGKKYFAFNEKGQMQTGLQYIADDNGFYYFDDNGYMQDGKISDVECDDDTYDFYFNTKNGKNGQGYTGEKDNYLYFNGKRLEADDDYRLYYLNDDIYLVNSKGKVQSTKSDSKKYDIENEGIETEDVNVTFTGKKVKSISVPGGQSYTADELVAQAKEIMQAKGYDPSEDSLVSIPFIQLYDDDQYTYTVAADGKVIVGWRSLNNK